jgi:hypothetical protein
MAAGRQSAPLLPWLLGAAGCGLVVCCGGGGIGVVALLWRGAAAATSRTEGVVAPRPEAAAARGKYPAPTKEYRGRTAEAWGRDALDIDRDTSFHGCEALYQLGSIPASALE